MHHRRNYLENCRGTYNVMKLEYIGWLLFAVLFVVLVAIVSVLERSL